MRNYKGFHILPYFHIEYDSDNTCTWCGGGHTYLIKIGIPFLRERYYFLYGREVVLICIIIMLILGYFLK